MLVSYLKLWFHNLSPVLQSWRPWYLFPSPSDPGLCASLTWQGALCCQVGNTSRSAGDTAKVSLSCSIVSCTATSEGASVCREIPHLHWVGVWGWRKPGIFWEDLKRPLADHKPFWRMVSHTIQAKASSLRGPAHRLCCGRQTQRWAPLTQHRPWRASARAVPDSSAPWPWQPENSARVGEGWEPEDRAELTHSWPETRHPGGTASVAPAYGSHPPQGHHPGGFRTGSFIN